MNFNKSKTRSRLSDAHLTILQTILQNVSKFINWITLLYSCPLASVRTNNTNSDYFSRRRSTRHGCPMSLLLFVIAIDNGTPF